MRAFGLYSYLESCLLIVVSRLCLLWLSSPSVLTLSNMGCIHSRACIGEICVPREGRIKGSVNNKRGQDFPVFSPASSADVQEAEARDHLNQLGLNLDPEVGITRLSRVSSQFLPADGSRIVKIPSENYELRYSFLSQRGYYPDALDKVNQDSFCIHTPFGNDPSDHFFGVFDGHGEFGAQCSQFVKRKLCENLLRNSKLSADPVEACHAAYTTTNSQLHADIIDDSMSGTTSITVLVRGRTIYVANSGDSRAVIGERRGGEIVAVDLSVDQTPFRLDELERVKLCGARVLTLDQIEGLKNPNVQCWGTEEDDDGDPPRLWVPDGMYPGTAFTRSIGDSIAETIGVVANPEIVVLELTQDHPFFVLASDGVFEFLSSQTVIDMVAKFKDPRDACAAIVAESYRLWLQYETRTDDITIIVVHINGLQKTSAGGHSVGQGVDVHHPAPQVVEVTGAESPSTFSWNARNPRARHDLSRARVRALESSLETGQLWVPPPSSHRKTWEEEAHIGRALHDHFLFRRLSDSQSHVLLDCMQRIEVQPGDIVVEQGGEGDCFYVVGSGEFEVLAKQEEKNGEVTRVLQIYTAEKLSSFGELALMYNKPLQASVRAVTNGTLWALKREDFRGILMSEFSNLPSLKLLRSVDLLSRLTILQLSHIAESLSEVSFSDGETIIDQNESLSAMYIIQKGLVRLTFNSKMFKNPNISSLKCDNLREDDIIDEEFSVEKAEGSYFGEWVLLGEQIGSLSAVAVGDVSCALLTKEKFVSVVGPLAHLSQEEQKERDHKSNFADVSAMVDISVSNNIQLSDLEWKKGLYTADCSEIGLVHLQDTQILLSLKRYLKKKVKELGKEEHVLREKNLMKELRASPCVPQVLCTCADKINAGILLNVALSCPLVSILHKPLDDMCAKFCAASVVIALEELHKNSILFRCISEDVIMLDQTGHLQLVDFRFGKKLSGDRTFTICGMADFLAPEIVQGKGHGFPADWWALGVLIYFMLQGEKPFGSWRENETDTFSKIAKGQLHLSPTISADAADLITKLLEVDEDKRVGSQGAESVKNHPWFDGFDWKGILDNSSPVPDEILHRITRYSESIKEPATSLFPPPHDGEEDLSCTQWFDDW
ncbi:hypothetical protein SAY87_019036 [Trapa incisa]|uniref:protein-serine/threonine phosphatase n=1 Tax=Trapa incisa TaxID=236973 RepID=A0AAN7K6B4_9MYRT|nr:hypothetical protein SAY87_019036 [Trapa incisa]